MGLQVSDVTSTLQAAYSGARTSYFIQNGNQYQVICQVERQDRSKPLDVEELKIKNNLGDYIPLSELIVVNETSNPPNLNHYNRFKSATFSASLVDGSTIGDGVKKMYELADKILDESFQTSLTGASRDFAEGTSNTGTALIFALLLIYFVLSAQFESFIEPFIIMVTVPMAICGALLSLWFTNQTLNIFSQIGMIMLIGLVTKNGILIVDFVNEKRKEGLPLIEAVVIGSGLRLRPILMTSIATALGSLPIALSLGASAASRKPLGIVVVGGVIFSLILSLFIVPAMYAIIMKRKTSVKQLDN